jgi:SAM-dependent methyltransferase
VPAAERDGWVDRVFGLGELPPDGPELPRGGVPYLPCPVDTLLRAIELADVRSGYAFVDIGSGPGRATALTHFLTGAGAIGIEVQSTLVRLARDLSARLNAPRATVVQGDAAELTRYIPIGSVFFLYCPFSGARLERVLDDIEEIAEVRTVRVCSVDLPLPSRPWLTPVSLSDALAVYRSR